MNFFRFAILVLSGVFMASALEAQNAFSVENDPDAILLSSAADDEPVLQVLPGALSAPRIALAEQLADEYCRKMGENTLIHRAMDELLPVFLKKINWKGGADGMRAGQCWTPASCNIEVERRLNLLADQNFKPLNKRELTRLAVQEFPVYEKGDFVTVSYMANPEYASKITGVYLGNVGGKIRISRKIINLRDIELVDGNEREALKFDLQATDQARKKFIEKKREQWEKAKADFLDSKLVEMQKEVYAWATEENEKQGYICWNGEWTSPVKCLRDAVISAHARWQAVRLWEAGKKQYYRTMDEVRPLGSYLLQISLYPAGAHPNLVELDLELKERQKKQEAERLAAEAEAARLAEEKAQAELIAAQKADAAKRQRERGRMSVAKQGRMSVEEAFATPLSAKIAYGIGICMLIGLTVLLIIRIRRRREEEKKDRFRKYFEGRGKLQKAFWDEAAADPQNFRYVAYWYPDLEQANLALLQLSYFSQEPGGDLVCKKDLKYGTYAHNGGAVAFVGGTKFNYALWKEASVVLPEIDGSEYFKQSPEPPVKMVLPNVSSGGSSRHISDLGVKDERQADGSMLRVYQFIADSTENARKFLEEFNNLEDGIVVRVQTGDGELLSKTGNTLETERLS